MPTIHTKKYIDVAELFNEIQEGLNIDEENLIDDTELLEWLDMELGYEVDCMVTQEKMIETLESKVELLKECIAREPKEKNFPVIKKIFETCIFEIKNLEREVFIFFSDSW